MTFIPVSVDKLAAAVRALPDKCCALDPFQTSTFRTVIGDLALFLAELVIRYAMGTLSTCFFVLRQLRSIRRSVPQPVLQPLVATLVFSRQGFSNATLVGIPPYLLNGSSL